MLSFDFKRSGIKASQLSTSEKWFSEHIDSLSSVVKSGRLNLPDGFLNLPSDTPGIRAVKAMVAKKATEGLGIVAVIGIGGSVLGAQAIAEALGTELPIIFFDNVDPD